MKGLRCLLLPVLWICSGLPGLSAPLEQGLGWEGPAAAISYRVELWEEGGGLLIDLETGSCALPLDLPPGRYRYRISAFDKEGGLLDASVLQDLVIRPRPGTGLRLGLYYPLLLHFDGDYPGRPYLSGGGLGAEGLFFWGGGIPVLRRMGAALVLEGQGAWAETAGEEALFPFLLSLHGRVYYRGPFLRSPLNFGLFAGSGMGWSSEESEDPVGIFSCGGELLFRLGPRLGLSLGAEGRWYQLPRSLASGLLLRAGGVFLL